MPFKSTSNIKAAYVDNAVKSQNVEETFEDLLNENVIKTNDAEKSSEPIEVIKVRLAGWRLCGYERKLRKLFELKKPHRRRYE